MATWDTRSGCWFFGSEEIVRGETALTQKDLRRGGQEADRLANGVVMAIGGPVRRVGAKIQGPNRFELRLKWKARQKGSGRTARSAVDIFHSRFLLS